MPRTKTATESPVEPVDLVENDPAIAATEPTIEQIVGGVRSNEFVNLVSNLRDRSEGQLESLARGFNVSREAGQAWKERVEAIAEAQLASMGISSYAPESGLAVPFGSLAPLITQPVTQRWPEGIRVDATGEKVRTRLYGPGFAVA